MRVREREVHGLLRGTYRKIVDRFDKKRHPEVGDGAKTLSTAWGETF